LDYPESYRSGLPTVIPEAGQVAIPVGQVRQDQIELGSIGATLRRRWALIIGVFLGCLIFTGLIIVSSTALYTATAEIVVDPGQRTEQAVPGTDLSINPAADGVIETEMERLTSRDLAGKVFDALHLDQNRRFMREALDPPGRIGWAKSLLFPGAASAPLPALDAATIRAKVIDRITANVTITRVSTSYAVAITVTEVDPALAARLANGYVDVYLSEQVGSKAGENRAAIEVLRRRVDELRSQAQADTEAVQQYRIRNNLLSQSATALTEQEISTYNQQLAAARAEAAEARARLAAARSQLAAGGSGRVGEATASTVVSSLRSQRAGLSERVADLSNRYLDTYPDLIAARKQLTDIDQQIDAEVGRTLRALEARTSAADGRLVSLEGSLGSARGTLRGNNGALVQLDDLTRRAEASQALYDSYLNRFKEVVAKSGAEQAGARRLETATPPLRQSSPNIPLYAALGGLIGLLLGAVAALTLENAYRGLTTGSDVERELGVRYLGGVPMLRSPNERASTASAMMTEHPGGMYAESLRGILAATRQGGASRLKVIAVTAALPGEGKTSTAIGLARVAGMGGERVALVDCDAVKSRVADEIGIDKSRPGMRDLLLGKADLRSVEFVDPIGLVSVFAFTGPMAKGERMLDRSRLQQLLTGLREAYDLVILDCGPLLAIAESREIAALADHVIVVTRWRKTGANVVLAALKMLPWGAVRSVGVILNLIDIRRQARFGGNDATSFYSQYDHYYG